MTPRITVAFQGEKGAYSEMAARRFFGDPVAVRPCPDFDTVFRLAATRPGLFGIIPIENSTTGSIHENYDRFLRYPKTIVGEIKLRISHSLIALPRISLSQVKKVYSHPQALAQCQKFLGKLKKVDIIAVYDTAGAVKMIRDQNLEDAAAVASRQAAIDYKMHVLASSIESNSANYTRFIILGKNPQKKANRWKTSVVFAVKNNVPGSLFRALGVFSMRDIDLHKIESRPIHGKPWSYLFYIDFQGHQNGITERHALDHLREMSSFIRILGSYEPGKEVEPLLRGRR